MFSICLPVTWNLTNSIVNENPYLNSTAISLLSTSEYWISTYRDWHVYISSMSRFFHIFSLKITFRICQNLQLLCSIWYVWGIVIISTNAQEKGFIQDFSILDGKRDQAKPWSSNITYFFLVKFMVVFANPIVRLVIFF